MTKVIVDTEILRKSLIEIPKDERSAYYGNSFMNIHLGTIDVPWAEKYIPPQFGTAPHKMARKTNISTSLEGAKSVDASKLEKEVYECVKSFGKRGATAQEIKDTMNRLNCWQRVSPLIAKGYLFDTGERRKTVTGRKQRVVVAKEFYDAQDNH